MSKKTALAIFSSDALSSVAYAPQETLVILLAAGTAAIGWMLPISIAVVVLLTIVVTSYRQTIYAYPSGGGGYIVARENLGEVPGLIAAATLVLGYVLTVSVSIASAIDQLISAAPDLLPYRVWLGVGAIALISLANLRGVRESGSIFAIPTYVFLAAMGSMLALGLAMLGQGTLAVSAPDEHTFRTMGTQTVSVLLLLRAFAVGSAVMTGTEAMSNGVPAFKPPEPQNAARTLMAMAAILALLFIGLALLIVGTGAVPTEDQTLVSLIARAVFSDSPLYYVVQGSAVLILVLAANTGYAGFPRLSSLLARDDYAPHQLALRGDRLAFSNGIFVLAILSSLLVIIFGGSTGALLPLYALSVFAAFTMSQLGMVRHWFRTKGGGWQVKALVNGIGATFTGLVALLAASTNFMDSDYPILPWFPVGYGAWLVFLIVPAFVFIFRQIKRHYDQAAKVSAMPTTPDPEAKLKVAVVVPVASLNKPTYQALTFARTISPDLTAVHVAFDPAKASAIEQTWQQWSDGVPLAILESPYRSLTRPLLYYLTELKRIEKADLLTVVLPEYVPASWWQHLLHGQSAQLLKILLYFMPGFVVISVPFHEWEETKPARDSSPQPDGVQQ